jgi:hypothetical protein
MFVTPVKFIFPKRMRAVRRMAFNTVLISDIWQEPQKVSIFSASRIPKSIAMPPAKISTRRTVPRINQILIGLCDFIAKSKPSTFEKLETLHGLVSILIKRLLYKK